MKNNVYIELLCDAPLANSQINMSDYDGPYIHPERAKEEIIKCQIKKNEFFHPYSDCTKVCNLMRYIYILYKTIYWRTNCTLESIININKLLLIDGIFTMHSDNYIDGDDINISIWPTRYEDRCCTCCKPPCILPLINGVTSKGPEYECLYFTIGELGKFYFRMLCIMIQSGNTWEEKCNKFKSNWCKIMREHIKIPTNKSKSEIEKQINFKTHIIDKTNGARFKKLAGINIRCPTIKILEKSKKKYNTQIPIPFLKSDKCYVFDCEKIDDIRTWLEKIKYHLIYFLYSSHKGIEFEQNYSSEELHDMIHIEMVNKMFLKYMIADEREF